MLREPYVLKLLRLDGGPGLYFRGDGSLTDRFGGARAFNRDLQAIEVMDAWNEGRPDRALFLCKQSEARKA